MLGLTGCGNKPEPLSVEIEDSGFYPNFDWMVDGEREERLETLAKEDFAVLVAKVIDKRRASAAAKAAESSRVMYEFNPDALLQSTPYFVQNELQKNLDFGRNKSQVYVAEVELTDARMRIMHGTFLSGKFGRYVVDLEANVIVRDENSLLVRETPLRIRHERQRKGDAGRQPSTQQDRARIVLALQESFEPLAIELAWQVRRAHLRRGAAKIGVAGN